MTMCPSVKCILAREGPMDLSEKIPILSPMGKCMNNLTNRLCFNESESCDSIKNSSCRQRRIVTAVEKGNTVGGADKIQAKTGRLTCLANKFGNFVRVKSNRNDRELKRKDVPGTHEMTERMGGGSQHSNPHNPFQTQPSLSCLAVIRVGQNLKTPVSKVNKFRASTLGENSGYVSLKSLTVSWKKLVFKPLIRRVMNSKFSARHVRPISCKC